MADVESVWHYTDAHALLNILDTGKLWASQYTSLNDLDEIREGWNYVKRSIDALEKTSEFDRDVLSWAQAQLSDSAEARFSDIYVLCASTNGDDANQWRSYGNGGRGYAIELDTSVKLQSRGPSKYTKVAPGWQSCLYSDEQRQHAFDDASNRARDFWGRGEALEHHPDEAVAANSAHAAKMDAHFEVAQFAWRCKNIGFSSEQECRTVIQTNEDPQFRATPAGITAYVEVSVDEDSAPLPIKSIRCGPKLTASNARNLERLLKSHEAYKGVEVLPALSRFR